MQHLSDKENRTSNPEQGIHFIIKTFADYESFSNVESIIYYKEIHLNNVQYIFLSFSSPVLKSDLSQRTGIPLNYIKIVGSDSAKPIKLTADFYICGYCSTSFCESDIKNMFQQLSPKFVLTFNISVILVESSGVDESDKQAVPIFISHLLHFMEISSTINTPCARLFVDRLPGNRGVTISEEEINVMFGPNIKHAMYNEDGSIVDLIYSNKNDSIAAIKKKFIRTGKFDISITPIVTKAAAQRMARTELKIEKLPANFDIYQAYELVKKFNSEIYRIQIANPHATMKTIFIQFLKSIEASDFMNRALYVNGQKLSITKNETPNTRNTFPNLSTPAVMRELKKPVVSIQRPSAAPKSTIMIKPISCDTLVIGKSTEERLKPIVFRKL